MDDSAELPMKKGVSLADLGYKPILVKLVDGSVIKFRYLSGADEAFLIGLIGRDITAREFVVNFLHHHLLEPKSSVSEVRNWPNGDLQRATKEFAAAGPAGFGRQLPDGDDEFETFRDAARTYREELRSSVRETLGAFTKNYEDLIRPIFGISESVASSLGGAHSLDPKLFGLGLSAAAIDHATIGRMVLWEMGSSINPAVSATLDSIANAMAESLTPSTFDVINGLSSNAANAINEICGSLTQSLISLVHPHDLSSFAPTLPDFAETLRRLAKARAAAVALDDAGFGYTYALWEMRFLIDLSDIDPQDRPASIFLELRRITEEPRFADELQSLISASSTMARRLPAVREGIEDHQRRRYFSSVSVLLPQVEGLVNDILTVLDVVIQDEARFYIKNPDGTQGTMLRGLENKSVLARQRADLDEDLAKFVARSLVPERNRILHGADPAFGQSERSVHLMLVLLSLALTVASLEEEVQNRPQT